MAVSLSLGGHAFRFLRRKPRVEFALLVILLSWLSHECFDRKPCCTGVKILFSEKWDINCVQMMCSSNLAQTHVRDIGL